MGWVSLNYIVPYEDGPAAEYLYKAQVYGGRLNVRSRTTTSSSRITQLANGTIIYINKESEDGEWGYIESLKGWVNLAYVKKI